MGEAKEKAKKKNATRYMRVPDPIDVEEFKIILTGDSEPTKMLSYSKWYTNFVRHNLPKVTDAEWAIIDELDDKYLDCTGGQKIESREEAHLAFLAARPNIQGEMYLAFTSFYRGSSTAKTVKPKDWDEPEEQPETEDAAEPEADDKKEEAS